MPITSYNLVPVVTMLKPVSPSPTGNIVVLGFGTYSGSRDDPPRPYGQLFPSYPPDPP